MLRPRMIAALYAIYASLGVSLLATMMPPFQNADEFAHALRADQISHLGFLGRRLSDGQVGGLADIGLVQADAAVVGLPFHRAAKVSRQMYAPIAWGAPTALGFPNTAVYPPVFYLPAALMAFAARQAGATLPHALVLMRLATGAATILAGTASIAMAGNMALWMFAILLLPMSLALSAALSQDGPLLVCTALAVAFTRRLPAIPARFRNPGFLVLCSMLVLVGTARPPYAAFALLLLTAPVPRRWRWSGFAAVITAVIAWSALNLSLIVPPGRPGGRVAPLTQLLGLAGHPARLPHIVLDTWHDRGEILKQSFIGYLGWLDVDLPPTFHMVAWVILGVAAGAVVFGGAGAFYTRQAILTVLAIFGAIAGILLIQYCTWTVVDTPIIDGLQGRYFLAPALLLALLAARPFVARSRVAVILAIPVLAFPIVSIAVTAHAVLIRYYF